MIQTLRTKSSDVQAIQFNGDNIADVEVAIKEVCDRDAFLAPLMEVGCWVLLTPPTIDRQGVYQVLPNSVVSRVYTTVGDATPVIPVPSLPRAQTLRVTHGCFACQHYRAADSHCVQFSESIDSELQAASDCHNFSPEV